MSLLLGSISATLGLDNSGFRRGIVESEALTSTFGQTFTTALTNPLLAGIGAMKSFGAAVARVSGELLDMAEGVGKVSEQTGLSAEVVQTFRAAVEDTGGSAQAADAAMVNFNRRLFEAKQAGSAAGRELKGLGVDVSKIGAGDQGFLDVIDQLSQMENAGARANATFNIFGREGSAAVLAIVNGGSAGFRAMQDDMERSGRVLKSSVIDQMKALDDRIDKVKSNLKGLERGLTSDFLSGLVSGLGNSDAAVGDLASTLRNELGPAAKELGKVLGEAVDGIRGVVDGFKAIDDLIGGTKKTAMGTETRFAFLTSLSEGAGDLLYGNSSAYQATYGRSITQGKLATRPAPGRTR